MIEQSAAQPKSHLGFWPTSWGFFGSLGFWPRDFLQGRIPWAHPIPAIKRAIGAGSFLAMIEQSAARQKILPPLGVRDFFGPQKILPPVGVRDFLPKGEAAYFAP